MRAAWGLLKVHCRHGAGWDTCPPPVRSNTTSGSAAQRTAPRSQSYGGEKASEASSAASHLSPAFHSIYA